MRTEWLIVAAALLLLYSRSGARRAGRMLGRLGGSPRSASEPPPVVHAGNNALNEYYEVLELPPTASAETVRQAYKELVKVWHPDRFEHDAKLRERATAKLQRINAAYGKLKESNRA